MSQLKIKNGNNWVNIPASGIGVPSGGNTGDILVKSSSVDYATEWGLNIGLLMGVPDYDNAYYVNALTSVNGSFTVPEDGYMHFTFMMASGATSLFYMCQLTKGNLLIRDFVAFQNSMGRSSVFVAVSKGCVLTCINSDNMIWQSTGTTPTYNYRPLFIPFKQA